MSVLPGAVQQSPACGTCGSETAFDGDDFVCEDCQICFDADNLSASFLDPETEVCRAACDNTWHGDNMIQEGRGYDCGTCELPADHKSFHWTGCEPRTVVCAHCPHAPHNGMCGKGINGDGRTFCACYGKPR